MTNLATLQRFLAAENARDWATWSSCLHPDVTYQVAGSGVAVSGADAYLHHMQTAYVGLPDWSFSALNTAESSEVIFVELDDSGHCAGTHRSRTVSGAPLHLQAVCVFELAQGRILRVREYLDRDGFDRQIEATRSVGSAAGASATAHRPCAARPPDGGRLDGAL